MSINKIEIIDGYNGGVPHIEAAMIRDHNISMYGNGDYVLDVGNKFAHEIVNNNNITIKDGMAVIGGARCILGYGKTLNAVIENGTSGYMRNDIIVLEYALDNATLVESISLKVVKGSLDTQGVDPELVTGDIRAGATLHQMPLKRVRLNGLSIEAIDDMWTPADMLKGAALPMNKGGTGADIRSDAFKNLSFLGKNPINSPAEDTTQKWAELGTGYAVISTSGILQNQPAGYSILHNYVSGDGSIVSQELVSMNGNSSSWRRSGNTTGFGWYVGSENWVRNVDEKALITDTFEKDNLSLSAGAMGGHDFSIAKDGYKPIGLVGVNFSNAGSNGANSSFIFLTSFTFSETTAFLEYRNSNASAATKYHLKIVMLYVKI